MTTVAESYHMTPEEFRRWGHETVDWIAGYLERIEDFPVLSRAGPRRPPPRPTRARRAVRGRAPRPGGGDPAGRDPLAVAQLLRLLPGQRLRALDPRRAAVGGPGRAGDALVDQPRLHGA